MPEVTAVEVLSLLLIQFGSTFEFVPDRPALRIVPLRDEEATVDVTYSLTASVKDKALRELRERFPKAKIEQDGLKVTIRATAEQHVAIARLLKQPSSGNTTKPPPKKSATSKTDKPEPSPLSQNFSLTVKSAPLLEVMKTFEASGVRFDYDREALEAANISLDKKVDIDAKSKTGEAILRELFGPLNLDVNVVGSTMKLRPKRP